MDGSDLLDLLYLHSDRYRYHYDHDAAESVLAGATTQAEGARRAVVELEHRLDKITLVNVAMWELLSAETDLKVSDLKEKMIEIDMRDGKKDNKYTRQAKSCGECYSKNSPERENCLFCGTVLEESEDDYLD